MHTDGCRSTNHQTDCVSKRTLTSRGQWGHQRHYTCTGDCAGEGMNGRRFVKSLIYKLCVILVILGSRVVLGVCPMKGLGRRLP